jgi:hypothetical protein
MKKLITILVAIATLSVCSVSESKADFSAGLRLGFNASKMTGDGSSFYKMAPGFHIGPYFRVGIKEKYRIQLDVLFSTKGSVHDSPYLNGTTLTTEKYYNLPFYLDLPIMFNYKPIAGLYVEAGVQPSIALTQLNFSANTTSTFNKDGLKTVDFAPIVGLGYEFKKVSLGVRGAFGVTNINKSSYTTTYNGVAYTATNNNTNHNMTLMATFGFKF